MPTPYPRYEQGVDPSCCKVRSCNQLGQEYPGQEVPFPYAHETNRTGGIVKRKPIFSYDVEVTCRSLRTVFLNVGYGADFDKLSEETKEAFCAALDRCDMEAISVNDCEEYITELVDICNVVTIEGTHRTLDSFLGGEDAYSVLADAWRHFVRLIWMRDPAWEDLVRCVSDPNAKLSVNEPYYLESPAKAVKEMVAKKLLVPMQVWNRLLTIGDAASADSYRLF
mmetsp:Transcript_21217/g.38729  ORF Transcript_21217/g.38729 Transcript_21217/m.38729 type:complete len:224 (+) Transcript_21217:32-703(+)